MEPLIELKLKDDLIFKVSYDADINHLFDDMWENNVSFISNHRDYTSQGELKSYDINEIDLTVYEVVTINAYIHGGISLSLSEYSCQFDSGIFGHLVFKMGEFGENNCGLEWFIHGWSELLNGNVYGYTIEKLVTCKHCNQAENELLDSCWGFYGYNDHKTMVNDILVNCDTELNLSKIEIETLVKGV